MDIKKHLRNPRYVAAKSSKIGCIISKIDWKSNCRHTSIVLLADVQGSFSDRNRGAEKLPWTSAKSTMLVCLQLLFLSILLIIQPILLQRIEGYVSVFLYPYRLLWKSGKNCLQSPFNKSDQVSPWFT